MLKNVSSNRINYRGIKFKSIGVIIVLKNNLSRVAIILSTNYVRLWQAKPGKHFMELDVAMENKIINRVQSTVYEVVSVLQNWTLAVKKKSN